MASVTSSGSVGWWVSIPTASNNSKLAYKTRQWELRYNILEWVNAKEFRAWLTVSRFPIRFHWLSHHPILWHSIAKSQTYTRRKTMKMFHLDNLELSTWPNMLKLGPSGSELIHVWLWWTETVAEQHFYQLRGWRRENVTKQANFECSVKLHCLHHFRPPACIVL